MTESAWRIGAWVVSSRSRFEWEPEATSDYVLIDRGFQERVCDFLLTRGGGVCGQEHFQLPGA